MRYIKNKSDQFVIFSDSMGELPESLLGEIKSRGIVAFDPESGIYCFGSDAAEEDTRLLRKELKSV